MKKKRQRRIVLLDFLWLIAAGLMLFIALFSYGEVKETTVDRIQTKITNIQAHSGGYRMSWVTFSSPGGASFYMRTDELFPEGAAQLSSMLQDGDEEKIATIAYTERKDLSLFPMLTFGPYKRVVQIEYDGQMIVSLEDYNNSNQGFLVGFIVLSVLFFARGCLPVVLTIVFGHISKQ